MSSAPPSSAATRILHLHVEKCGGTSLRLAIARALGEGARVFPQHYEREMIGLEPTGWDLISGHCGWQVLQPFGGRIVTLLRDPVDRFISSYFYWGGMFRAGKDSSNRARIAHLYTLDDFATLKDEQSLSQGLFNNMTWQLAYSAILPNRMAQRDHGITDSGLLATAIANLGTCDVVGVQDRMETFAAHFQHRLGLPLNLRRENVTAGRPEQFEISAATRRRILEWVYLDMELYQAGCAIVAARTAAQQ